jgi:hypothetical protein
MTGITPHRLPFCILYIIPVRMLALFLGYTDLCLCVDACGRSGQGRLLALSLCLGVGIPYLRSRDKCPMMIYYLNVLQQLNVLVLMRGHFFGNVTLLEANIL